MSPLTFLPNPRHIHYSPGNLALEPSKRIALQGAPPAELFFSAELLRDALRTNASIDWTLAMQDGIGQNEIGILLRVDSSEGNRQAYDLTIADNGATIIAGSAQGIFYGVCTLIQILEQSHRALPCLQMSDSPDFADRGVMLDISRDKVPTMETLFGLVDMLASWKINQLQLYTEHTFAYRNHRTVWQDASPLTGSEIAELDRYCKIRFISLVPNQNSFGHMHRWLKHPAYRDLAECPNPPAGSSWGLEPFTLNPLDPRCLELLRELYDDLLPYFSESRFNVGCDETFDLGKGQSREECLRRGVGRVYLDFLLKIHREVTARNHKMMFWGDIVANHPQLVPELPRDMIALEWGYEADHPFGERTKGYTDGGIPFYVCPGTSSWNSIAGRTANAVANIQGAAASGLENGAIGLLNTDWGDNGHWQYLPISFLGMACGAAVSWCLTANREIDLPQVLDRFAFRDTASVTGRVVYDLGNIYRETGAELENSTVLFHLLRQPIQPMRGRLTGVTRGSLHHTLDMIDRAVSPLERANMQRGDGHLIKQELYSAAQWMRYAVERGLLAVGEPERGSGKKEELAATLETMLDTHKGLWHARNRPGGFRDSVARLERMRQDYRQ